MKTLKDHLILYDDECPMCNLYTKAFVQTGMLDETGRASYQCAVKDYPFVNRVRAVNEIAIVNRKTGSVTYGVKSIMLILQNSFPVLTTLFNSRIIFWLADKLYKFISYNRRVIVPSTVISNTSFLSSPSFHATYRLLYLAFSWVVTSLLLHYYSFKFEPVLAPGSFYREFMICGGQMLWQLAVMRLISKSKSWDYLGNMMTISLAGALALGLINMVGALLGIGVSNFYLAAFTAVVFLMLLEHIRRTRLLGLGWIMTASWVLYRLVVLMIIL